MAKVPYIPLYIGDWEQDTNCLSLQAEAAWLKIIFKMFKDKKSGTYKTSTKSLQNLWKTDLTGVQDILAELEENNVCGLEINGSITFTNRRMVRELEISKIRSEAVQNRYKNDTNTLQNPEYDNEDEIDNENEDKVGAGGNLFDEAPPHEPAPVKAVEHMRRSNVKTTDDQDAKLRKEFGDLFTDDCYTYLSDYKIEKNYTTKSDYLTIRRWVVTAVKEKNQRTTNGTTKNELGAATIVHADKSYGRL